MACLTDSLQGHGLCVTGAGLGREGLGCRRLWDACLWEGVFSANTKFILTWILCRFFPLPAGNKLFFPSAFPRFVSFFIRMQTTGLHLGLLVSSAWLCNLAPPAHSLSSASSPGKSGAGLLRPCRDDGCATGLLGLGTEPRPRAFFRGPASGCGTPSKRLVLSAHLEPAFLPAGAGGGALGQLPSPYVPAPARAPTQPGL